jgi:hypothetical protein
LGQWWSLSSLCRWIQRLRYPRSRQSSRRELYVTAHIGWAQIKELWLWVGRVKRY